MDDIQGYIPVNSAEAGHLPAGQYIGQEYNFGGQSFFSILGKAVEQVAATAVSGVPVVAATAPLYEVAQSGIGLHKPSVQRQPQTTVKPSHILDPKPASMSLLLAFNAHPKIRSEIGKLPINTPVGVLRHLADTVGVTNLDAFSNGQIHHNIKLAKAHCKRLKYMNLWAMSPMDEIMWFNRPQTLHVNSSGTAQRILTADPQRVWISVGIKIDNNAIFVNGILIVSPYGDLNSDSELTGAVLNISQPTVVWSHSQSPGLPQGEVWIQTANNTALSFCVHVIYVSLKEWPQRCPQRQRPDTID